MVAEILIKNDIYKESTKDQILKVYIRNLEHARARLEGMLLLLNSDRETIHNATLDIPQVGEVKLTDVIYLGLKDGYLIVSDYCKMLDEIIVLIRKNLKELKFKIRIEENYADLIEKL